MCALIPYFCFPTCTEVCHTYQPFTRSGFLESISESEDLSRQVQDEKQLFLQNLKDLHLLSELNLNSEQVALNFDLA